METYYVLVLDLSARTARVAAWYASGHSAHTCAALLKSAVVASFSDMESMRAAGWSFDNYV